MKSNPEKKKEYHMAEDIRTMHEEDEDEVKIL